MTTPNREELLALLVSFGEDGASLDELLHRLPGVPRQELRAALKALVSSGGAAKVDRDFWAATALAPPREGRVAAYGTRYSLEDSSGETLGTFDSAGLEDAIAGDRVRAEVTWDDGRRPPALRVTAVLERAPRRFEALPHWLRGTWVVVTPDAQEPVVIAEGGRDLFAPRPIAVELTGERRRFAQLRGFPDRVLVGRPAVPPSHSPVPRAATPAIGVPRRIVGELTAAMLIDRVARDREVDLPFPPEAVATAAAAAAPDAVGPGLDDLTAEPLVTIDGADAKDFDDAVSARELPEGIELLVAIADVSAYVPLDSPLDLEARRRGSSVYLPGRVYPMLPPALSDDVCSLRPGVLRRCAWVRIVLDRDSGDVRRYDAGFGVMRSRARLIYEDVQAALDSAAPIVDAEVTASLALLERIRVLRYRLRLERGMLDLDLPEVKVGLTPDGADVTTLRPEVRLNAHRLIEECMLVANETVADLLASRGWPAIRRVHGDPSSEKIATLNQILRALGVPVQLDRDPNAEELNAALASMADDPRAQVLAYRVLRSLPRATYAVEDAGHFGVGARRYLHFTSPIRRYPDLEVHRVLRLALDPKRPPAATLRKLASRLAESAELSNQGEQRATESERDCDRVLGAFAMRHRIGQSFDAQVTDITPFGVFAAIADPRVDGLIPFAGLGREHFERVDEGAALEGEHGTRIALGDRVRVRCAGVDVVRGRIQLEATDLGRGRNHRRQARVVVPKRRRRGV